MPLLYKVIASQRKTFSVLIVADDATEAEIRLINNDYGPADAVEIDRGDWDIQEITEV